MQIAVERSSPKTSESATRTSRARPPAPLLVQRRTTPPARPPAESTRAALEQAFGAELFAAAATGRTRAVGDRVTQEILGAPGGSAIQAKAAGPGVGTGSGPGRGVNSTAIPSPVKAKMEAAFGADFSGVRVHPSSSRAVALGAVAYTQGSEIHVAPGRWAPETRAGQVLLGHELAHVVQQRAGRVPATAQHNGVALNDDPSLEAEADALGARAAAAGERAAQQGRAPAEAKPDVPASTFAGATQRMASPDGTADANYEPLGGGLELKRKYYYAAVLAPLRKLALAKPKPGVWNKDLQVSKEQGRFTFDIIEPFDEAARDVSDPAGEAERTVDREMKRKRAHYTLKKWQEEYAAYQKIGYWTPDQISGESLRSHGEEIASGLEGQLGYVDDQGSDEAVQRETESAAQRAARIERGLARMGVASGNQMTFVIAKHGDAIVAIGSAHGGYIDHVVANPDSQLPKLHRPGGTVSGGGRAVTHKMIRLMIKKGIRPTVSPVSPRAKEGLSRYFAPPLQRKAAPLENRV